MNRRLASGLAAALLLAGVSTPAFAADAPKTTTATTTSPAPGLFFPAPHRILDTRFEGGLPNCDYNTTFGPNSTQNVVLASCTSHMPPAADYGVPASATAVVVNVTATNATDSTYLSVGGPDLSSRGLPPAFSTLNVSPGHDVANLATIPVGPNPYHPTTAGITVYNHVGTVDVVIDVLGYYTATPDPSVHMNGLAYTALPPARFLDTRESGRMGPGAVRKVKVRGVPGIPANASSVAINLTATGGTGKGFLAAYMSDGPVPTISTLNYEPGKDVANQAIVPIADDGTISVYNHDGWVDAVVDVVGAYSTDGKGLFVPVTPSRLLDTRTIPQYPGLLWSAGLGMKVAGQGGIPADASGAVLNLTATGETAPSHVTVWPHGSAMPNSSSLNVTPGTDVANHLQTALGTDGVVEFSNHSGSTQLVVDAYGYFTAAAN